MGSVLGALKMEHGVGASDFSPPGNGTDIVRGNSRPPRNAPNVVGMVWAQPESGLNIVSGDFEKPEEGAHVVTGNVERLKNGANAAVRDRIGSNGRTAKEGLLFWKETVLADSKRSAECGVRSAECGVRSAECGVRSAECGTEGRTLETDFLREKNYPAKISMPRSSG